MTKMTYTALALFLACGQMAHAELMPSQPLESNIEATTLAGSLLERTGTPSSLGFTAVQNAANNSPRINTLPIISTKITTTAVTKSEEPAVTSVRNTSKRSSSVEDDGLMDRMNVLAAQTVRRFNQSGLASWYGRQFNGRPTASGERFDMHAMTAAHRSLPLNCYIRVTNQDNGKSVVVKVNDRGPFHGNRILDLSYGAAEKIGIMGRGVGNVTIERIDAPNGR